MNLNTRFRVTYVVLLCLLLSAHFIHIDAKKKKHHKKSPPPSPPQQNDNPAPPDQPKDSPAPPPSNNYPAPHGKTITVQQPASAGSDATEQFNSAWKAACQVTNAVVLVPKGETFLVKPMVFEGQSCEPGITFQVDGTIEAPEAIDDWGSENKNWLNFKNVPGFKLIGEGTIDARAQYWWDSNPGNKPTAVRIGSSTGVTVSGITFTNSPQAHLKFNDCNDVHVSGITIESPENSPNTDGIHISGSTKVDIRNSKIACGDDCISMAEGCKGITINNINCGPSHGISIGSLGQNGGLAYVSDINVTNCVVSKSDNGVRIKSYKDGKGLVENVVFSDIKVENVKIGISIDQYYTEESNTKGDGSFVKVKNIVFKKITGTFTKESINLFCGPNQPCTEITLEEISLKKASSDANSAPVCQNAYGDVIGSSVGVANCLK